MSLAPASAPSVMPIAIAAPWAVSIPLEIAVADNDPTEISGQIR